MFNKNLKERIKQLEDQIIDLRYTTGLSIKKDSWSCLSGFRTIPEDINSNYKQIKMIMEFLNVETVNIEAVRKLKKRSKTKV